MAFKVVVLPEPDGPNNVTNSPLLMQNEALSTASDSPKSITKFLISIAGNVFLFHDVA